MSRLFQRLGLRAFRRDQSGVAVVEFVLVAPVVIMALVALMDIGTVLYVRFQLDGAVNAAANYAMVNAASVSSANGAGLASNLASVVASAEGSNWANSSVVVNDGPSASNTGGTSSSSGTASAADSCYCPSGTAPSVTWGGAQTCGAACPSGGYAGKFVLLTATKSYSPVISGYGFVNAGTISSSSMVQVQ
jgi:Flp pilus assembly protein TadG